MIVRTVKKIHGRNRLPVIHKKRAPGLGRLGISGRSPHPAGDASLRYLEAEHEQFAVDAGSTPGRILRHHTEDQIPHFLRQSLPTNLFSRLRDKAPLQAKTSPMPADDRRRINQHEGLLSGTPETTGEYPEDFVNRPHPGPRMLALQRGQRLTESEIFHKQISMRSHAAGEQA